MGRLPGRPFAISEVHNNMDAISFPENITLKNVSFSYGGAENTDVLGDITLSVRKGEFVSIVGPSGCGKSTLLSLVAGLNRPTGGSIAIDGVPVSGPGRDRGVVFQHYSLFPWMTARANIVFALQQARERGSHRELAKTADRYLELVGLKEAADKFPCHLSGGMQQRVAIARAFAVDSPILLMDEPFSAVDTRNRVALQELLLKLRDNGSDRKTVLFITHDIDEAIILADRVVVLSSLTGSVREQFKVPFSRPRHRTPLLKSPDYVTLRNGIIDLFHKDESEILAAGDTDAFEASAIGGVLS
ncbi:MAG: ABC transporter ATP-binding protein [Oryzomonas sp.]|uniref:ABC transporter ATP-binding protein n=1 Tax=Oryzomonas sp. TaxID=2855186 RepID=UPI002841D1A5|nr:ABC transporter ATP-binding protein [Oryzomonas sp.]MDR3578396.1 ABC transporter ATP-binding protein [Oryzomonas sp.]